MTNSDNLSKQKLINKRIMFKLAFKQLVENKRRTLLTIIGIMLSVSMITAVAGFVVSAKDAMHEAFKAGNGNWHIMFYEVSPLKADEVLSDNLVESGYTQTRSDNSIAVYMRINNIDKNYVETAKSIADKYGFSMEQYSSNTELLASEGIISPTSSLIGLYYVGAVLFIVIIIGSVIVIANAFNVSTSERKKQFGILKSIGATKSQIIDTIVLEGFILSIVSIPLGIALGFLVEFIALGIANYLLTSLNSANESKIVFNVIFSLEGIAVAVILSLITIFLSAYLPARKASRVKAIEAIRQIDEIKINPKKVKVSKFTEKFLGIEGVLAAKTMKRNKRKFRAMTISLIVGIVLVITASGFGSLMNQLTGVYYADYGINIVGVLREKTYEENKANLEKIKKVSEGLATLYSASPINKSAKFDDGIVTEFGIKMFDNSEDSISFVELDEATFAELCKESNLSREYMDENGDEGSIRGIVYNSVLNAKEPKDERQIINYEKNMKLSYYESSDERKVEVVGETIELPKGYLFGYTPSQVTIFVSSKTAQSVFTEPNGTILLSVNTDKPKEFISATESVLGKQKENPTSFFTDLSAVAEMNNNITLLMKIFIYGFVAMLSLIEITSVIGTISSTMALRRTEFAMLASVGMTEKGMKKMLNYESMIFTLKAVILGVPLGIGFSYLMFLGMGLGERISFVVPWLSIAICLIATGLLTTITILHSANKLRKISIVDALKQENI